MTVTTVTFVTHACDSVSRRAATPPDFTLALMLPVLYGRIRWISNFGASA